MSCPLKYVVAVSLTLALTFLPSYAQFNNKKDAFSQSYNDDKASQTDSVDVLFSFKEYFGGLSHKNEIQIGTMFAGSVVIPGGCQIYNKQYWKLPVVYGGIAAGITGGIIFGKQDKQLAGTLCYAGAGLVYWGSLMDGVVNFKSDRYPLPGRSTLYSVLLPGLGQIYNGEYWKVPIYVGLIGFGTKYYLDFSSNYKRWRRIYNEINSGDYHGPASITSDQALFYRNYNRRYRDYFLLGTVAAYVLQIIDANVFAYMHTFDVSDDLSLSLEPTVITSSDTYAYGVNTNPAMGLKLGLTF